MTRIKCLVVLKNIQNSDMGLPRLENPLTTVSGSSDDGVAIGAEYANAYNHSEFGDSQIRTVILRHHIGLSASAFYGASLQAFAIGSGFEVRP